MMKRWCIILCTVLLLATSLLWGLGCADVETGETLQIVTTIFPEYDWVRQLLGAQFPNAQVTLLQDNGVDLHNYQPSVADLILISNCDLFLYVGGESDKWVADALQNVRNPNQIALNLLTVLGDAVKEEEPVAGVEQEDHDHDHAHEDDHEHEHEVDEHVWLSLKNAKIICRAITQALQTLDTAHHAEYEENLLAYTEKLTALDARYRAVVDTSARKTIVFGDRFPFRYLADDYGITYYAAFTGCSAETEASFETVKFLADQVDQHQLMYVLTLDGSNQELATTIIAQTTSKNQHILTMDSMQSAKGAAQDSTRNYLSVMEQNLVVLQTALQ